MGEMKPAAFIFIFFLGLWHLASLFWPPYILPSPIAVFEAFQEHFSEITSAMGLTLAGALSGLALSTFVGLMLSFIFSQARFIRLALYPYAIFLQTVPIVAIAPLLVLWFGHGFLSVVMVAFIVSIFPIITNGTDGLNRVDEKLVDLFAAYRATRFEKLIFLQIPYALPSFATGIKIASGLAVVGAVFGEFFAGYGTEKFGLGYLIILTSGQLKTAYLFAAIIASTMLGLGVFLTTSFLERALSRGKATSVKNRGDR